MDQSENESTTSSIVNCSIEKDEKFALKRRTTKNSNDRRRSARRRKNVQPAMQSSALPTRIFHEKSFLESSIVDGNKTNAKQQIIEENPSDFVFRPETNVQPKLSFWTVNDRDPEWYKLTVRKENFKVNSNDPKEKFQVLDKSHPQIGYERNFPQTIENPNNITQMIMKALMKDLDYDLDGEDLKFLEKLNRTKTEKKEKILSEDDLENAIIILEFSSSENIRSFLKQKLCDDDATVCDICLLPDGDDENQMVFCERCHTCVHQNCYGISVVPSGKWFCRSCSVLRRPSCFLCPNTIGPMKPTSSGTIWCHLTCALWLPELKFSDYAKMEPILNLDQIPHARWSLRCVVCSTNDGACIQCAQKKCRTPFHVTCALISGYFLDVQQTSSKQNNAIRSQFNAYCSKHSAEARRKSENFSKKLDDENFSCSSSLSSSSSSCLSLSKPSTNPLTIYRREQLKREKWSIECAKKFFKFVSSNQLNKESSKNYDRSTSEQIFDYWKSKREKNLCLPLIPRIDFILEQRENGELLISQINVCLKIRTKIFELERKCKSVIDRPSVHSVSLNQRFENLKEKFISTRLINRSQRQTIEKNESTKMKSTKRQRKSIFYSTEHHQIVEQAKSCQVLLESTYRNNLQLNTTYFLVKTIEGQMILLSKTLLEETNLISLIDSNENRPENNEQIEYSSSDSDEDNHRKKIRKTIDISIKNPYRSQGNVVTCVTGSFN